MRLDASSVTGFTKPLEVYARVLSGLSQTSWKAPGGLGESLFLAGGSMLLAASFMTPGVLGTHPGHSRAILARAIFDLYKMCSGFYNLLSEGLPLTLSL